MIFPTSVKLLVAPKMAGSLLRAIIMGSTNIALEAWKEYWQAFIAANNLSVKDKDYRLIYLREYARFRWNNDSEYRERVNKQERERTKNNPEKSKAKYQEWKQEHREEFNAYWREYNSSRTRRREAPSRW